ncbi:MAG: phosphatase PAP2 family protein [Tannerellaceae bacterium]|nr:phosphatase PAP2 family protein [Tannerellaceae bacterium]
MFNVTFPDWDRDLFIYLNSKNLPWLDQVMILLSTYTVWGVVFLLVAVAIMYRDKLAGTVTTLYLVLGLTVTLLLNTGIKLLFLRPRPGEEDLIKEFIYLLEDSDDTFSFFSAHSASSFYLATFTALYFKNKLYGFAIYAWALAVAYSRIYVGRHYPLDVLVGMLFGVFMGWLTYWFYNRYGRKKMLNE